ncbi:DUF3427 domain-containing protein [Kineosporia sp. R_H_3]|uniref:DUF3427 domain-containing protein n=1 Tax=Kineosporia sp. R_H_3 TaxID=1961848 RepID=UPI000B4B1D69|nr:DUF3427 domain-containing protein [Kineosporia sp. R_H_3]
MSAPLEPGLFEVLVTEAVAAGLASLSEDLVSTQPLRAAEAADRISLLVSKVVGRVVSSFDEGSRTQAAIAVAREIVDRLAQEYPAVGVSTERPDDAGRVLRAILRRRPDGTPEQVASPMIPLLDTTLLTNSPGEPSVGHQLATEIQGADGIDLVMAFIRRSGIRSLEEDLARHCSRGRRLRVLTTTYTGSTEQAALDALTQLGAQVRVSYDTTTTRLHAKAWLFHRESGFSTAYIGSSNLTHSAQVAGLEWNVRVSGARNPEVIDKVGAVFEAYWQGDSFIDYDPESFERELGQAVPRLVTYLSPVEVTLRPFQERLLERLAVARGLGYHRNLLVAATGTGKTVMAAADYARLRAELPSARLLFIAHRQEILEQSLATFRHVLREGSFGELWVGGRRPAAFDHVFASIQSLDANGLAHLDPQHFDVVIIDEFHHAAAATYRRLLARVEPRELVGLTATPERSDGEPILEWFGGRIAAELRLWDAIDQHYLTPFAYYGIADETDLTTVPWQRGRGYDVDALTNIFTSDDAWARRVVNEVMSHVDLSSARVLGFCVSVAHAEFMAEHFSKAGFAAVAVTGKTPEAERRAALSALEAGQVRAVFSVDLFNEGLDIPAVDTVLFLRPTDSPVLFLQQLGRGLRRSPSKHICTVLDFVANHRKEFRFDRRFGALLGGSRQDLERQVTAGFPFLPAGCSLRLDHVAQERVLRSIREAIPSRWPEKVAELRAMSRTRPDVDLPEFLAESGLDLDDVYRGGRSWTALREAAGLPVPAPGPHDVALLRGVARLGHVDDSVRLVGYRELLALGAERVGRGTERDRRLARMLTTTLMSQLGLPSDVRLEAAWDLLHQHPRPIAELQALMAVLRDRVDHVQAAVDADSPLQIHARYSRQEILAGLGAGRRDQALTPTWREGVRWIPELRTDVFVVTLDKSGGGFSPTTRYQDYAISPELFHWESQSTTSDDSPTGRRYRSHRSEGSSVQLFVRSHDTDPAFWFLGPCDYVSHRGSRPMAVTWRLRHRLPGDLYAGFAAAVA